MRLWVGEDRTLSMGFSIVMAVYFYFWIIRFVVHMFKNAQGLWWEDRFRPFCEGILNLILNILMVRHFGLFGVVLSTIIAMLTISVPWETYVLFKVYFKRSMLPYFVEMFKWILLTVFSGFIAYYLCQLVSMNPIMEFIIKTIICLLVPNICFYVFWHKSDNIQYAMSTLSRIINKKNS